MDYVGLVEAGIGIVKALIERGQTSGELSPTDALRLRDDAVRIFETYKLPPPHPIGDRSVDGHKE